MVDASHEKLAGPLFGLMLLVMFVLPMWRVGYYDIGMFRDDVGVVFTYARNLIETGQIFYNEPADRLDGFTSMLDIIFALPLYVLAPESMFVWNYYLKALITCLVPVATYFLFLRWGLEPYLAAFVAFALASSDVLSAAFGMQLEGAFYGALILVFFACLLNRDRMRASVLILTGVLLCLTRPEAIALVASALGFAVILDADSRRRKIALGAGSAILACMGAWYAWRIAYFGYWAPNTYYAKLSGSRMQELADGFNYVWYQFSNRADVFLLSLIHI
mgnify:CR=1 FL=1